MTVQPQQQKKRKIITIKDPNTKADVTNDILSSASSQRQSSTNTPPSGRSSVDTNQTVRKTYRLHIFYFFCCYNIVQAMQN